MSAPTPATSDLAAARLTTVVQHLSRAAAVVTVVVSVVGAVATAVVSARVGGAASVTSDGIALLLSLVVFAVVGAMLIWKRPQNPVGWVMSMGALLVASIAPSEAWAAYVMTTRGQPDAVATFGAWGNAWYWLPLLSLWFVFLPLLFPDGLPSRRWRPVLWVAVANTLALAVLGALAGTLHGQDVDYEIANPIGIAGLPPVDRSPAFTVLGPVLVASTVAAVAAVIVRFRRARGVERQQLKWFLFAIAITVAMILLEVAGVVWEAVTAPLFSLAVIGLPASVGMAVLRYRLYEIDRIISRTISYAIVTLLLVAIYGLVAIVPAAVFATDSAVLVATATLAAAAAFGPARRRVQAAVDRRFNRAAYDAAEVAARFAARVRNQVRLDELNVDLSDAVTSAVQPASVALWLRAPATASSPPARPAGSARPSTW